MARLELECFGGPLCGSRVPDTDQLWMCVQHTKLKDEQHFYKRIKMIDSLRCKSLLIWHYHGTDPEGPGVPMIRPSHKKFR